MRRRLSTEITSRRHDHGRWMAVSKMWRLRYPANLVLVISCAVVHAVTCDCRSSPGPSASHGLASRGAYGR